ncbi:MAG: phenylacetic acid degradation protein PaaD [Syntrophobacteraceae bacterium CG07_land_8_20_14_0_80_61_8]|nr:MAG: phenylacetic acid degradation protein PaaD [Syntrophobacteraceae bacterium CG07_land_8_20_14_0_80_61_8]
MDENLKRGFRAATLREPLALKLGLELVEIDSGYARVAFTVTEEMLNLFGSAHGGAVFALIDEAFELACNSHGSTAVALSMNVTYTRPAEPGARLTAEASELNRTRRTALYDIQVHDQDQRLVACCRALAYRKGEPLPFALP